MGLYDTMQQKGAAMGQAVPQLGGANGGSFAQKQPMNPMMKPRPMMGSPMGQGYGQPNPAMRPPRPPMPALGGGIPGGSPQNYNSMKSKDLPQPIPQAPPGQMTGQLPNLIPPGSNGAMSSQLNPSAPPEQSDNALVRAYGGGQLPMSPVPELPMGNVGRPAVMDRGIGPSNPMDIMSGMGQTFGQESMQQMNPSYGQPMMQPPMQMDENGLEPRRGPR